METISQKALSLHLSGKSQREIARILKLSQPTVFRLIREAQGDPAQANRCPCCGRKLPKQAQGDSDA